jgi:hypothetical protein
VANKESTLVRSRPERATPTPRRNPLNLHPEADRLLRDLAFVFHATQTVRRAMAEAKAAGPA